MLTREENLWNFIALRIVSTLNILPIEISPGTVRIRMQSIKWRRILWKVFFILALTHWLYMLGRFAQLTLTPKLFRLDHIVVHVLCLTYGMGCFWEFLLFIRFPSEVLILFNQLFDQSEPLDNQSQGSGSGTDVELGTGSDPRIRPLFSWPVKYSLHELLARFLSIFVTGTEFFCLAILMIDPSRPQLLYFSVPEEYQSWWIYFGLLPLEAYISSMTFYTAYFSLLIQVQFLDKCSLELTRMEQELQLLSKKKKQTVAQLEETLTGVLSQLRELSVFIQLFNRAFPFIIFSYKVDSLMLAIFFYYFTILKTGEKPLLCFFTGYTATVITVFYSVIYRKAFTIPQRIHAIKMSVLHIAGQTKGVSTKEALFKRQVQQIQNMAIRVGSFSTMTQTSTPEFIDYIVNQVVSLLVGFN